MPGVLGQHLPAELSLREKPPTRAKSFLRACWVASCCRRRCSRRRPLSSLILRPLTPPVEFT